MQSVDQLVRPRDDAARKTNIDYLDPAQCAYLASRLIGHFSGTCDSARELMLPEPLVYWALQAELCTTDCVYRLAL